MKKRHLIFLCFVFSLLSVFAQTEITDTSTADQDEGRLVKPLLNEKLKVGVKMGVGTSAMLGSELKNPKAAFALSGGMYLRYRLKKHLSIQPEANISYRGANFNNGPNEYHSIIAYWLEAPVLMLYGLDENNVKNIVGGLQYSRMLNSSLYLTGSQVAESSAVMLHKDDLLAILGMQFHTPFVGFQIVGKYGLINLNNGILPNLNPPNTGKSVHQCVIEINLLF